MARERTIPGVLADRLATDPDGPFLEFDGRWSTATEADAASRRVAQGLVDLGVRPGDRVASLVDNCAEAVSAWLGTMQAGAVAVPVNTALKGALLSHQLADSGTSVAVVQADLLARVAEVVDGLPDLKHCVVLGEIVDAPAPRSWIPWDDLAGASPVADGLVGAAVDPATIIYTAGTTGPSKGCLLSHAYMVGRTARTQWVLERTADDILWTPLPLFHVNAFQFGVLGAALTGSRSSFARRFSVSGFWPEIRRTGATLASLLGSLATLIARAPDHPDSQGSRLRLVLAVPAPPEIDQLWHERFGVPTFSGMYGQTEASPLTITPPGTTNRPGAAGKANDLDFEVRLFDDDDREVPVGQVGEIVCRPRRPGVMFDGYWQHPDATVRSTRNLWFHTGDLGRIDDDGFVYFVDRKQDYLRRRGENISSYEVESYLLTHGGLEDVAAHAVPSPLGEDEVKVTAVVKVGHAVTEEELCRFAAGGLPYFAIPRYVELRADLPRSPVGRVLKTALRDEGVTASTWDREAAGVQFERR